MMKYDTPCPPPHTHTCTLKLVGSDIFSFQAMLSGEEWKQTSHPASYKKSGPPLLLLGVEMVPTTPFLLLTPTNQFYSHL